MADKIEWKWRAAPLEAAIQFHARKYINGQFSSSKVIYTTDTPWSNTHLKYGEDHANQWVKKANEAHQVCEELNART